LDDEGKKDLLNMRHAWLNPVSGHCAVPEGKEPVRIQIDQPWAPEQTLDCQCFDRMHAHEAFWRAAIVESILYRSPRNLS
jgi:hypothetical protein